MRVSDPLGGTASSDIPESASPEPRTIDATFRNGSLTAISVVLGFSLTFLNRWAALPGTWLFTDLCAVGSITAGIGFQVVTLANMLSPRSLLLEAYHRATRGFLISLTLVGAGVAVAIVGDIVGYGQRILGG